MAAAIGKYFRKNKFYLLGFLVLSFVLIVNAFPKGYVFSGGDTSQLIEAKNNLRTLFYEWSGKAVLYYGIFYLLDILGVSDTAQLSWYLGIFLIGSYVSFSFFSRIVFAAEDKIRMLASLFYSLNLYTLFLFSGNLSFSHYPTLYIFVPALVGLFIKFLKTEKIEYGIFFVFVLLLSSSGFGNPAFVLSLSIFLLLIFVALSISGSVAVKKSLLAKIALIGALSILINAFWLLPIIPQMRSGVAELQNSNVLEFGYTIRHTASPILNTISMVNFSGDYFPENFPYEKLYFLKKIILALSFLPMLVIFGGLFFLKSFEKERKKYFLALGAVSAFAILLIARVVPPFEIINYYIFRVWGMETLRGFDKVAIYFPFVLASMLLIILVQFKNKKWLEILMIVILLLPLPFYLGKIQQNMSYRFSGASPQNKDFRKSKLSFLVKIPKEYYEIRGKINSESEKAFIATLPYTSSDGSGISNFPKWKMYGADITRHLYSKTLLPANASYFSDWNFAQTFNEENLPDNQWLVKLLGMMDVKYIIYHKDSPEDSVLNSQEKMKKLEQQGLIENLEDNDYFTLYEIKKDYTVSYISWQKENVSIESDLSRIGGELDKIINNSQASEFKELNPKKFEVKISKDNFQNGVLILAEKFDSNWKAYLISKDGKEKEIGEHILARGYANGWIVHEDAKNSGTDHILIEYYPTRLMARGLWISAATALFLLVYLVVYYYGRKKIAKKAC